MSALPAAITERDARDAVARLAAIHPGNHRVVSCYLKLEPRDRARGKYLIKMKNRVKEREAALSRQPLSHQDREAIAQSLGGTAMGMYGDIWNRAYQTHVRNQDAPFDKNIRMADLGRSRA